MGSGLGLGGRGKVLPYTCVYSGRARIGMCVSVPGRLEPIPFELKDDNMGLGRWTYEVGYIVLLPDVAARFPPFVPCSPVCAGGAGSGYHRQTEPDGNRERDHFRSRGEIQGKDRSSSPHPEMSLRASQERENL